MRSNTCTVISRRLSIEIKPQNLKLTEQGDVILLDFGLAKGAVAEMSQTDESMLKSLPGFTYHYAPLEQILGTGTDPRSDLYALAATIYRLITGRPVRRADARSGGAGAAAGSIATGQ